MTVSVVPRSLLRDQDAFVLGDALRNASGVERGHRLRRLRLLHHPRLRLAQRAASCSRTAPPSPESTFYPLYNVRQVEVLKGPAAFLYGGNPLAGAVQLVRKQPAAAALRRGVPTYGRFGTFEGAVDANAARADGTLAFRLNGVWQGDRQLPRPGRRLARAPSTPSWPGGPDDGRA